MSYMPIGWKDYPNKTTPVSAENLNHMDEGIMNNDAEIASLKEETNTIKSDVDLLNENLEEQSERITKLNDSLGGGGLAYNAETDYFGMTYNGVWHDVLFAGFQTHYLYHEGDEITHLTGGFASYAYQKATYKNSGYTAKAPTLTKHAKTMEVYDQLSAGSHGGTIFADKPISLDGYTTLKMEVESAKASNATMQMFMGFTTTKANGYEFTVTSEDLCTSTTVTGVTNTTYSLNISGLTGYYYLALMFGTISGGYNQTWIIRNIWLE